MISSREDFLMTILQCGELDLKLIDGVQFDWCDVFDYDQFNHNRTLPSVMSSVFGLAKSNLDEAINERYDYLEDTKKRYGISEEQEEEMEALKLLCPYDDLEEYHNYIDTHITCVKHKELYKKYLQKELDEFAENTGFEVEF